LGKVIITCAVTGAGAIGPNSGAVPILPSQIAAEAVAASRAGAAIVHVHVREPGSGKPSMDLALYRETVDRIRDSGCGILINLTMGAGGRFIPGVPDPLQAGPGSSLTTPARRVEHVVELKPEICTLDLATMNFGNHVIINTPPHLVEMAQAVEAVGTKIELEVFDLGGIDLAHDMMAANQLHAPMFQLCMGIKYGADPSPETLLHMKSRLPAGAPWAAFAISRHSFPLVALSHLAGGHVRVGLEDNLYLERGRLASSNSDLVVKARRILEELGAEVATPSEARAILGISAK
jgi:uncharacterized protein (DUF849 family)